LRSRGVHSSCRHSFRKMDLLVAVAMHPEQELMIASDKKRTRKQCEKLEVSSSAMGERYQSVKCEDADKLAATIIDGLRKEKPLGHRNAKREPKKFVEEFVYPNVQFRFAGARQRKGARQQRAKKQRAKKQGELKGVRVKLSGKKLAVWKLENSDLLARQRVDDIAACARRDRAQRAKNLYSRKNEVESDEEVEEVEEAEERYQNSLHNKELQVELGDLVDILRATDAEAEARLRDIL